MSSPPQTLVVYAIMGSHYVFKVLAAMQDRGIDHFVFPCSTNAAERKQQIPSKTSSTPELLVLDHADQKTIVPESEDILHWLDANCNAQLFPTPQVAAVSERASDGKVAACVWYYNWVNEAGHLRSLRPRFGNAPNIEEILRPMREMQTARVKARLPNVDLQDEPTVRELLGTELKFFQSLLETEDQPYLIAGTERPTAADFSLYALLERLVGDKEQPASDFPIAPSVLDVKTKDPFGLARLWKWHDAMRQNHRVQFKREAPADVLERI